MVIYFKYDLDPVYRVSKNKVSQLLAYNAWKIILWNLIEDNLRQPNPLAVENFQNFKDWTILDQIMEKTLAKN